MDFASWRLKMTNKKAAEQLAFTFQMNWGPVNRNVERRCILQERRSVQVVAPQTGELNHPTTRKSPATAGGKRSSSACRVGGGRDLGARCRFLHAVGDCLEQCVRAEAAAAMSGWAPEWCSPLQQLSATEQKSAPQALYSNSRRGMEEEEKEDWWGRLWSSGWRKDHKFLRSTRWNTKTLFKPASYSNIFGNCLADDPLMCLLIRCDNLSHQAVRIPKCNLVSAQGLVKKTWFGISAPLQGP